MTYLGGLEEAPFMADTISVCIGNVRDMHKRSILELRVSLPQVLRAEHPAGVLAYTASVLRCARLIVLGPAWSMAELKAVCR